MMTHCDCPTEGHSIKTDEVEKKGRQLKIQMKGKEDSRTDSPRRNRWIHRNNIPRQNPVEIENLNRPIIIRKLN